MLPYVKLLKLVVLECVMLPLHVQHAAFPNWYNREVAVCCFLQHLHFGRDKVPTYTWSDNSPSSAISLLMLESFELHIVSNHLIVTKVMDIQKGLRAGTGGKVANERTLSFIISLFQPLLNFSKSSPQWPHMFRCCRTYIKAGVCWSSGTFARHKSWLRLQGSFKAAPSH